MRGSGGEGLCGDGAAEDEGRGLRLRSHGAWRRSNVEIRRRVRRQWSAVLRDRVLRHAPRRPRAVPVDHDAAMAELYGVGRQAELGECERTYRVEELVGQRTSEFQRRREATLEWLARTRN